MSEIDKRKELRDQQLKELFENNFDCYTSLLTDDGEFEEKAMTMEKFVEVVSELLENNFNSMCEYNKPIKGDVYVNGIQVGVIASEEQLDPTVRSIEVQVSDPGHWETINHLVNEIDDKNIYIIGCDTGLGESKSIMSRIDKEKGTCEIIDDRLNKIGESEPFILRNLNVPLNMTVNEPKQNHKRKPSRYGKGKINLE